MAIELKPTTELTDVEILELYGIHQKKYFEKGFGRDFEVWKEDLSLLYHKGLEKRMFIYRPTNKSIEGYAIATKPFKSGEHYWSKLLEFSVNSINRVNNKALLSDMVSEITSFQELKTISYLAEINSTRSDLLKLYHSNGFEIINDLNLLNLLISFFMPNGTNQKISEDQRGIIIERPTKLTEAYRSYWLTNHESIL